MTNPSPRPALRKAADAEVHPAAPRPARSPRARSTAPAPAPVPDARPEPATGSVTVAAGPDAPAPLKPPKKRHADSTKPARPTKRKFSGATSDHLRIPDVPEVTSSQRAALDHLFENGADGDTKAGRKKAKAPKAPKPVDLMDGKPVDLGATVPKALRRAARDRARERGLDIDTVVTDLLFEWVTEHH
jgi:hypothetical protein